MDSWFWRQIQTPPSVCISKNPTVLFLADGNETLTWSSAVVVNPHQRLMFCTREAVWITVAFVSAWTSLTDLCWPLSSTRRFCPQTLGHFFFFFFAPIWVNSRDSCVWNSQESRGYRNTQTSLYGINNPAKITERPSLFWWLMWICLPGAAGLYLHAFMRCAATTQSDIWMNKWMIISTACPKGLNPLAFFLVLNEIFLFYLSVQTCGLTSSLFASQVTCFRCFIICVIYTDQRLLLNNKLCLFVHVV